MGYCNARPNSKAFVRSSSGRSFLVRDARPNSKAFFKRSAWIRTLPSERSFLACVRPKRWFSNCRTFVPYRSVILERSPFDRSPSSIHDRSSAPHERSSSSIHDSSSAQHVVRPTMHERSSSPSRDRSSFVSRRRSFSAFVNVRLFSVHGRSALRFRRLALVLNFANVTFGPGYLNVRSF
ncbi:hypothetical protein LR48_Vigan1613s000100 [Vigna angularis]|nr:hypothetical protein LR48_Vigan1613s000100 [Vigna angularis]